jgi:hypothetical protein
VQRKKCRNCGTAQHAAGGGFQEQKQNYDVQHKQENVREMMPGGIRAIPGDIQHMGHPRQWMPVSRRIVGPQGPYHVGTVDSLQHMRISCYVIRVIKIHKTIAHRRSVEKSR